MGRLGRLTIFAAWLLGAAAAQPAHALELQEMGRFQVTGAAAPVARDQAWTVHSFVPDTRRPKTPVILLPGYDLTAYIYQATPDRREGWVHALAQNGYGVYVVEDVIGEVAPPAGGQAAALSFDDLWSRWGIGGAPGEPYGNVRFPYQDVGQVYATLPRAMHDRGEQRGPDAALSDTDPGLAKLLALLSRVGPAVLVGHGEAAALALRAATARPSSVRGLVGVEPAGCAHAAADVDRLAAIPFLAVFGDYIQARGQAANLEACRALAAQLSDQRGGRGDMLVLPEEGTFGNTYLLMQDDNNDEVAAQIVRWMDRRVD